MWMSDLLNLPGYPAWRKSAQISWVRYRNKEAGNMSQIVQNGQLLIPLYHGTSSLFLSSIKDHGLGGRNPVKDWDLLELSRRVLELSENHLKDTEMFAARSGSFRKMTEQKTGRANWQHGDTYLSPAGSTALRYAIDKRFGSELLTYTLGFLDELVRRDVPGVKDELYCQFSKVFGFLEACPSPVLIEANQTPIGALAGEDGSDASANLQFIEDAFEQRADTAKVLIQQANFRLREPVPVEKLRFWLVSISQWRPHDPEFELYEINVA